jgi:tetratricopeptide (TPR) repeat protein
MILKRILTSSLLQLLILSTIPSPSTGNPDFGLHLYRMGEHAAAVIELERWLFHHPEDPFEPYARYFTALSLAHTGQYRKSVAVLESLIETLDDRGAVGPDKMLLCESHLQLLNLHFRERKFRDFEISHESFQAICPDPDPLIAGWEWKLALAVQVYNRNWQQALDMLRKATDRDVDRDTRAYLEEGIRNMQEYRTKVALMGGLLSVVPGLGYLYAGRPLAGMRSFLINLAGIGMTVFCFIMGMPVLGTLFCVVETALFITNVYGGVNAVLQQNARRVRENRDEMLRRITVPPLDAISVLGRGDSQHK